MASPQYIIVGLGNPGPDYFLTRHNIGFMAIDRIAADLRAPAWQKKFKSEIAPVALNATPLLLVKPQTFMNLSGEAVGEALRFYKLAPENLIVFHDDVDLAPAKVKVKQGGGHGGHNGLKSLDQHIGQGYWRVRLGVGHPNAGAGPERDTANYVLASFPKADRDWLGDLLAALSTDLALLLSGQQANFMTRIAGKHIGPAKEPKA